MILLFLGILLHGDLKHYMDALKDSVSSTVGVILQYPFYAGIMNAAEYLKVPTNIAAIAIAWGDQWTNMIQPFWALPALAVANLKAKNIMGFMCIITIASGIIFALGIYIWAKLYS